MNWMNYTFAKKEKITEVAENIEESWNRKKTKFLLIFVDEFALTE